MKILDCTLRDGGYYTNWDFEDSIVNSYVKAMNKLPVDILEIGYRNMPMDGYMGRCGYCPASFVKQVRENCVKELALMLNVKSIEINDLPLLLNPIVGLVDWIRLAVDPNKLNKAISLAKEIKRLGFKVGFNVMYMSKWHDLNSFYCHLGEVNDVADIFSMVDSYGGVMPDEIERIVKSVKDKIHVPLGFHGHNNLQFAITNSMQALKLGVEYVDATILGMGRGAGNLNLELLLNVLGSKNLLSVDYNILGEVVSAFTPLQEKYRWGTSLPYMISGAYSIPQSTVMEWVSNRIYSFNTIVRALSNKKDNKIDNAKYEEFIPEKKYSRVVIIGGGNSVVEHVAALRQLITSSTDIAIIYATTRHADRFLDLDCDKFYILVGSESKRMLAKVPNLESNSKIVLPPYPRVMGTDVPSKWDKYVHELSSIDFISGFNDSCTAVAIQTAIEISDGTIMCVGYDGYPGNILSEKEVALTHENRAIFEAFERMKGERLCSLTPTLYNEMQKSSVYQYIM